MANNIISSNGAILQKIASTIKSGGGGATGERIRKLKEMNTPESHAALRQIQEQILKRANQKGTKIKGTERITEGFIPHEPKGY